MTRLLTRLFAWMAILTFAIGAKLHLPLVQATGWLGMSAAYATIMPLDEAVAHATSGGELCVVCEYVRDAEHLKQTGDAIIMKAMARAETPPLDDSFSAALPPPAVSELPAQNAPPADLVASARKERPETPPPRAA